MRCGRTLWPSGIPAPRTSIQMPVTPMRCGCATSHSRLSPTIQDVCGRDQQRLERLRVDARIGLAEIPARLRSGSHRTGRSARTGQFSRAAPGRCRSSAGRDDSPLVRSHRTVSIASGNGSTPSSRCRRYRLAIVAESVASTTPSWASDSATVSRAAASRSRRPRRWRSRSDQNQRRVFRIVPYRASGLDLPQLGRAAGACAPPALLGAAAVVQDGVIQVEKDRLGQLAHREGQMTRATGEASWTLPSTAPTCALSSQSNITSPPMRNTR